MERTETGADAPRDPRLSVQHALETVARAVHQHRIYPVTSPLCEEASEEARRKLMELGVEEIALRVEPHALIESGAPVTDTRPVEEFGQRLFRADIGRVTVRADAPLRELRRFFHLLATWEWREDEELTLPESLAEQGVSSVRLSPAERLEVLDVGIFDAGQVNEAVAHRQADRPSTERDRQRRAFLRVDTDSDFHELDLLDLALLIEDQHQLASVLSDQDLRSGADVDPVAIGNLFRDLIRLNSSLSPEQGSDRFAQLADLYLSFPEEVRETLTRDFLLPDLLEGGQAGRLMQRLPQGELRDSIALLGELEIGAPGLVELALRRLDLAPDAELALGNDLRSSLGLGPDAGGRHPSLDGLALSGGQGRRDLRELAAFDLAIDASARETLAGIAGVLGTPPDHRLRLRAFVDVMRLVRNPDAAERIASRLQQELGTLLGQTPSAAAEWIPQVRQLAEEREEKSPEVAGYVQEALRSACTPDFVRSQVLLRVEAGPAGGGKTTDVLEVFGELAAPACVDLLEQEPDRAVRRHVVDYMCDHAEVLVPGLLPFIEDERWRVVRNVTRVLGFAGSGNEDTIDALTRHDEPRVAREAFLALARVASRGAVTLVVRRLDQAGPHDQPLAEEALWRFPADRARRHVARLLELEYCLARPALAIRIVEELADPADTATGEALRSLARARWRFWRPSTARVGRAAARTLRQGAA